MEINLVHTYFATWSKNDKALQILRTKQKLEDGLGERSQDSQTIRIPEKREVD